MARLSTGRETGRLDSDRGSHGSRDIDRPDVRAFQTLRLVSRDAGGDRTDVLQQLVCSETDLTYAKMDDSGA